MVKISFSTNHYCIPPFFYRTPSAPRSFSLFVRIDIPNHLCYKFSWFISTTNYILYRRNRSTCMNDKQVFTEGSIFNKMIHFMLPILGALILQAMYGAVDMLIVGRFGTAWKLIPIRSASSICVIFASFRSTEIFFPIFFISNMVIPLF